MIAATVFATVAVIVWKLVLVAEGILDKIKYGELRAKYKAFKITMP